MKFRHKVWIRLKNRTMKTTTHTLSQAETETIIWTMWQDYITNDFTFSAPQTKTVKKLLKQLDMNGIYLICKIEEQYATDKSRNFNRFIIK